MEMSIFSLNNDLVRLTKILNNLAKDLKILSLKVTFQCLKLVKSFQKKICEEYLSAVFIILVSLRMTLFSEKVLISKRRIIGLMPNLTKKSWKDSTSKASGSISLNVTGVLAPHFIAAIPCAPQPQPRSRTK